MDDNRNSFIGVNLPGLRLYDFKNKEQCVKAYMSYMLCRTQSMFKYKGLPDNVLPRILELQFQTGGFTVFTKVGNEIYNLVGGLGGAPDYNYMPTVVNIDNPALQYSANLKIGTDCIVIPNDSMYMGLLPMFSRWATQLVENDITLRTYDINARIVNLLSAPTDSVQQSALEYLKKIEKGDLGVIADDPFFDGLKMHSENSTGGVSLTELIEYHQYLKAGWFNELGLQSNYNMKREAINGQEAGLDNDPLIPLIDDMLKCRKEGLEKVNSLYGTNITVEIDSVWKERKEIAEERVEISGQPETEPHEEPVTDSMEEGAESE